MRLSGKPAATIRQTSSSNRDRRSVWPGASVSNHLRITSQEVVSGAAAGPRPDPAYHRYQGRVLPRSRIDYVVTRFALVHGGVLRPVSLKHRLQYFVPAKGKVIPVVTPSSHGNDAALAVLIGDLINLLAALPWAAGVNRMWVMGSPAILSAPAWNRTISGLKLTRCCSTQRPYPIKFGIIAAGI